MKEGYCELKSKHNMYTTRNLLGVQHKPHRNACSISDETRATHQKLQRYLRVPLINNVTPTGKTPYVAP